MSWDSVDTSDNQPAEVRTMPSGPRPFLPIVLALVVLRGAVLPWVTVRPFSGDVHRYNLTDVRGGIGIIMTIVLLVVVGSLVSIANRVAGITIVSIAVAMLGWMAAISGILLGIVGSLLPSINVAGLDLTRASVGQGSGVAVSVIASLALAFLVVRHHPPLSKYSPENRISLIPLVALMPLMTIAVSMHAEWMRLGNSGEQMVAVIAGDSLYGSGLVVLILWLSIGLWIGALVLQRPLVMRIAGAISVASSVVVVMYTVFLWLGGKALWWLLPQKAENWVSMSIAPTLYFVLVASVGLLVCGILSFFEAFSAKGIQMTEQRAIGSRRVYTSDLLAVFLFAAIIISLAIQAAD